MKIILIKNTDYAVAKPCIDYVEAIIDQQIPNVILYKSIYENKALSIIEDAYNEDDFDIFLILVNEKTLEHDIFKTISKYDIKIIEPNELVIKDIIQFIK